jgi:hypothetical protein
VEAGNRISGRIFNSTFKFLVKYEEKNIEIKCVEGFLFTYLKHTGSILLHDIKAVTVSKRHF